VREEMPGVRARAAAFLARAGTRLPVDSQAPPLDPHKQRYIIRLIFMVPVYAIGSWFSLKYRDAAIYFDTVRDW